MPESKTAIDVMLEGVDWQAAEEVATECREDLPYVTHSGVLAIGEIELHCYKLSDGKTIFDAEDFNKIFE